MLFLNTNVFKFINKLYKHSSKCDDQQQFKDIVEAAMVSTPEGFNDNSHRYPMTPTPVKTQSAENHCVFSLTYQMQKKLLSVKLDMINRISRQLKQEIHHGH